MNRTKSAVSHAERKRLTRESIERAMADILRRDGTTESITFKDVAAKAGVTEMTVYRHFRNRKELLRGLWESINRRLGDRIVMPGTAAELLSQTPALFEGFDKIPGLMTASVHSEQGRELRASLNAERQAAFLGIVREVAGRDDPPSERAHAAVIQLLHSAFAWSSMREQWGLSGKEAGRAALWAIEAVLADLRKNKNAKRRKSS